MKIKNIIIGFVGVLALLIATFSCTDDTHDAPTNDYGFVQFKLIKNGSIKSGENPLPRAADADQLDSLSYAKQIKITLKSAYDVVETTLSLSAVNNSETESGLWSEKLKLIAGDYFIAGYELLDNLNRTILTYDEEFKETFSVINGGLSVEDILVNVRPRGLAKFQIVKDFSQINTRSAQAYRLDNVAKADVTIEHSETGEIRRINGLNTKIEYFYESDKNGAIHSRLACDSIIPLKAGNYKATSFIVYDKNDKVLEAGMITAENNFAISDSKTTVADVPVTMQETQPGIHDGIILKKIWDALGGPNWSYRGIIYTTGANWNFDRDMDLWVAQPGVKVLDNGHVASISLGGFGARGDMPEELGELSELKSLMLGTHNDGVGSSPIFKVEPDQIVDVLRSDFKNISSGKFALSAMAPEMWLSMPDSMYIKIHASQSNGASTARGLNAYANDPRNFTTAVTSLPKSIGKLKNLTSLFIASGPIASLPEELALLEKCTDVEIYNCPNLTEIPKGLMNMPKLQMVYFVNNNGISSDKLYDGLKKWTTSVSARSLQGLYFMNNNLKVVPDLRAMKKLGFLDLQSNQIEYFETPFGKEHNFGTLNVAGNKLKDLPRDGNGYFAGFEAVEEWSFSGNQFTQFPDIFDASSPFLMGTLDFSQNKISSFENGDNFKGVNVEILNLSFNPLGKFYKCIYNSGTKVNYLMMRGCEIREFEENALKGEFAFITTALDLAQNRLKKLPTDFNARTFTFMSGLDLSGNAFEDFAWQALNVASLQQFLFRGQRNDAGYRCMRVWPSGIFAHRGLKVLYLGSNDIRKVFDGTLEKIRFSIELTDNPNLSIDLTPLCPYMTAGQVSFLFDPGQDVRGCDAVVPKY